jgi:hypothetical protein
MDKLKELGKEMEDQMKDTLIFNDKDGFWYEKDDKYTFYTDEGIRLSVYEDLRDTLNYLYSDCAY